MHVDMFVTTYVCNLSPPERLDRFGWVFYLRFGKVSATKNSGPWIRFIRECG